MTNNTPITDAELAEVKRLYAAATPGEWRMFYGGEPLLIGVSGELVADMEYPRDAEAVIALHNAFDPLLARLEAAERERDERTTMAARAQEALRYVMNGLPTNDAVWSAYGNADSARAWLAARDAQQRREGAIEALEDIARDSGIDGGKAYIATVIYREFPDVLTTRVGVVEGADLLQAAQRLREGGK